MRLLTILFTSFISTCVFGQIDENLNSRNNIITPKKIVTKQIKHIDIKEFKIIDTIQNPLGYLIQNLENESYSVALKKCGKFITFKLTDYEKIDSISRVQLNKNNYKELIIFFSQEWEWSHADLGLKGNSEYLAVFDLHKMEIIFNEEISNYENTWGHNSDGIEYNNEKFFKYDIELNEKEIIMKINKDSSNEKSPLIIYEYKRRKLIRKNTIGNTAHN
ncbi:hypothetical protein [Kordia jejudonensis]|uniref:hypothetical protein n=1 Tax=Kordia jejudonensis TaxID=1348245 RepID=UPI0012E05564|nr:hypothetical protein [Kordia jejudonensis]